MGKVVSVVTELLAPVCAELGYELVDVEYEKMGGSAVLRLLIDKPSGIALEDCQIVSHAVDPILDAADPVPTAYNLEVSSPGLERPLKKEADFRRFVGCMAAVRLHAPMSGQRSFQGILKGWQDGLIVMQLSDSDQATVEIPFGQVAKAHLIPQF